MSSDTCEIISINDLLAKAAANELNITTTIGQCPDICALAWGSGNPDLSGIGANISYLFQAILTFLCGPLLCLIYELRHRWRLNEGTQTHISRLHDSFLDISAQFSIPVAIAAVIRFRQNAPFYELAFLRSLTTMQFMSMLSTAITASLFKGDHRRGLRRIAIITLYALLEFGFYMGLIGGLTTNQSSWAKISELSEACKAYGRIFPWIKQVPVVKANLPHVSAKEYFNPANFSGKKVKFVFIIMGFILAGVVGLFLAIFVIWGLFELLRRVLSGKKGWRLWVFPMSLAFTTAMLVEVGEMERTRNFMKSVAGDNFQDNQWGFGQVIALFLWMPLCTQLAYYLCRIKRDMPPNPTSTSSTLTQTKAMGNEKSSEPQLGAGSIKESDIEKGNALSSTEDTKKVV